MFFLALQVFLRKVQDMTATTRGGDSYGDLINIKTEKISNNSKG